MHTPEGWWLTRAIEARETDTVRVAGSVVSPGRPPTGYGATPTDNATQVNAASTLLGLALDQLGSPGPATTIHASRGSVSNVVDSSPGSGESGPFFCRYQYI